ncbi:ankyrin repeat-containing domain protein [Aspergillus pseudotamarii]|uniref:Ankyrin repeat-containing domain protein n=1 Tax=Aspergillus pseudotamarii TaxID=132259 RepID=A0A5N6SYI6_ASPPS|nr:ankyrin repeat-containing domain protein [Aspergillus pseudotamarii]KAE8138174.1 ankyrin repeat-containing domain protein [Aspergillus pseudotamarii]
MLEKGADIESTDLDCSTPLICAASHGHEDVVRLLLERGADLEDEDDEECTPVIWAASQGHEAVVRLLIEKGPPLLECANGHGKTALTYAIEGEYESVVNLQLEYGARKEYTHGEYPQYPPLLRYSITHRHVERYATVASM